MTEKHSEVPTLTELAERRLTLEVEIGRLEHQAQDAEQAAAVAMAKGKSTDAATGAMDKAQTQLRIARAALAAIDRAMASAASEEKQRRALVAQEEADRLDAEAQNIASELYRTLETALGLDRQLVSVKQQLGSLAHAGARARFGDVAVPLGLLETMRNLLARQLQGPMPADALRAIGLSKPPSRQEAAIAEAQTRLASFRRQLAETEKRAEETKDRAPRVYDDVLADLKRAIEAEEDRLAALQGKQPAHRLARERERQLAAL